MADLMSHIEECLEEASRHMNKAREMMKEPEPGLAMWLMCLGGHLKAARDAIDQSLTHP